MHWETLPDGKKLYEEVALADKPFSFIVSHESSSFKEGWKFGILALEWLNS